MFVIPSISCLDNFCVSPEVWQTACFYYALLSFLSFCTINLVFLLFRRCHFCNRVICRDTVDVSPFLAMFYTWFSATPYPTTRGHICHNQITDHVTINTIILTFVFTHKGIRTTIWKGVLHLGTLIKCFITYIASHQLHQQSKDNFSIKQRNYRYRNKYAHYLVQ